MYCNINYFQSIIKIFNNKIIKHKTVYNIINKKILLNVYENDKSV